jgi:hypothetical protein
MSVEIMRDEGQTLPPPTGRVLGVVETRKQLDEVAAALKQVGFDKVRVVHGDDGVKLLERFEGVFWGDAEGPILQRHLDELKRGHGVFAVQTSSKQAAEVAEIAARHGARFVVHFGFAAVTWLQP